MSPTLNRNLCYKALQSRDRRHDGRFFTAVKTTGIYCRPICPARIPLLKNITFFRTAAEAAENGFRPCKRCRPEAACFTPYWYGTSATVSRALRMIQSGYLAQHDLPELSEALGVSDRYLRQLFADHLGTSPMSIENTRRLDFARDLLDGTSMKIIDISHQSGFSSVRRFNDAFVKRYGHAPSQGRKVKTSEKNKSAARPLSFSLSYRPPYDWQSTLSFLRLRAIPGLEFVDEESYSRSFSHENRSGWWRVKKKDSVDEIQLEIHCPLPFPVLQTIHQVRQMFDVDADPYKITETLDSQKALQKSVKESPGLRVPGCWDGFEIALRAIIGQLISVEAATTICRRLVEKLGKPVALPNERLDRVFPTPKKVYSSQLKSLGVTRQKERAIKGVCEIVFEDPLFFQQISNIEDFRQRLLAVPGIGEWTTGYILMRLSEPDHYPVKDLILEKQLTAFKNKTLIENCHPWRAYAALHLWRDYAQKTS